MIIVGNRTSTTVKSLETANGTYTYTYDAVGNILSINDGTYTVSYVYDGLNQLVRENDQRADTTTVFTYTNGNITGKKVYKYTLGNVGEEIKSTSYGYSNSEWRDLLTSFNGQAVTYDEIGNPLTFGSKTFEWCGRQLERITDGDNTYVYAYNTDGDRVSKTVNGVKTEYFYNGSILAGQKTGDETLIFMYDNNGDAFGFIYNGEEYYYIKNVQNDIVAIADKNGTVVANYYYDAWGNVTQITGNTALAQTNPLRYRSYYYDSETGYYHLKSRYYSPEVGRFLNADGYAQTGQGLLDKNMFAYCLNNPVSLKDPAGCGPEYIIEFPAEGNGPVEITSRTDKYDYSVGSSYNSDIGNWNFSVGVTCRDNTMEKVGNVIKNVYTSISDNIIDQTIQSLQLQSVLMSGYYSMRSLGAISSSCGIASLFLAGVQVLWDFSMYENDPAAFAKACAITAVATTITVLLSTLIVSSGVGVGAAFFAGIVGGVFISSAENYARMRILGETTYYG